MSARAGGPRVVARALAVARALVGARALAAPAEDVATRQRKAVLKDADDLRRLARWGDENGLERTADPDWEEALSLDPDDEGARKRLRWLRRDGAWVHDLASWAIATALPDARPDRRPAYAARRRAEFERASAARHREVAAWCRAQGRPDAAEAELRLALRRDPDDPWSRLALGEVPDPEAGWVPADVRFHRIASARAASDVLRLTAVRSDPIREEGVGSRSEAAATPLSAWRLREWRLETDLPDEDASQALATVDLGARWFRERFGIEAGAPVLPGAGVFVVLSTEELYGRVLDAEPGLTKAERGFGRALSAMPVPHEAGKGPWVVVVQRPEGVSAADACLHYAMHFLFQARYGVEAQEAWLYEGLAAYATLRVMGTQGTWCVRLEETAAAAQDRAPNPDDWATDAAVLVWSGRDETLRRLVGASLNELDGGMLVKSWSMLRWMFEEHGAEAVGFLEARRGGLSSEAALRAATGLSLDDVDAAWRLDVRATEGE